MIGTSRAGPPWFPLAVTEQRPEAPHDPSQGADALLGPDALDRDRHAVSSLLTERVYGTLTVLVVLVGLLQEPVLPRALLAALDVALVGVGLWLARLVAERWAYRAVYHRRRTRTEILNLMGETAPLLLAPAPAVLFLLLAATGAFSVRLAMQVSLGVELAFLAATTVLGVWKQGLSVVERATAVVLEVALGGAVILIRVLVGH